MQDHSTITRSKGRRVLRSCLCCSKSFAPLVAEVNRGRGRYCSRECVLTVMNRAAPSVTLTTVERVCPVCLKPFLHTYTRQNRSKRVCCSPQCAREQVARANRRPLTDRFWEKVDRAAGAECCWPWTAARRRNGYGIIGIQGSTTSAHRVAYELTRGAIPEGMQVLHTCDHPECVNPAHLYLGTDKENARDRSERGRLRLGEQNHSAKLTAPIVAEIRRLLYEGLAGRRQLAECYSVSRGTIDLIAVGRTWRHIS